MEPRRQWPIQSYTDDKPYRLLYVSTVNAYKHQWNVVEAVARLREQTNLPLSLDLVGHAWPRSLDRLQRAIRRFDPNETFVRYRGEVSFDELHKIYHGADAYLFASSCENLPNNLLEPMAAGLPIACSNRGPMPEVLGAGGVYFDPENVMSIRDALHALVHDPSLRSEVATIARNRARSYSWDKCAAQTFSFFRQIAHT